MLQPTKITQRGFVHLIQPPADYHLQDVQLDIVDERTAVFKARLMGPPGASVWARAWLGSEAEGTLGETASPEMKAGDEVTLSVKLVRDATPEGAYIRIESAPLQTRHVMSQRLSGA
jgi:hypothetical protein